MDWRGHRKFLNIGGISDLIWDLIIGTDYSDFALLLNEAVSQEDSSNWLLEAPLHGEKVRNRSTVKSTHNGNEGYRFRDSGRKRELSDGKKPKKESDKRSSEDDNAGYQELGERSSEDDNAGSEELKERRSEDMPHLKNTDW
ncbi:hypothetical protein NDU88_011192 [Pleurodeles waltl]|uniref:Uncharacterized protein n=1 Tax=Pleurodeles waltl TaxID=8319 RepID=A0AAV7R2D9_PLEWA|nr:hypothetical protein NDU88_011192 [Pleurodeles waltl]